jgi:hypothetical protein
MNIADYFSKANFAVLDERIKKHLDAGVSADKVYEACGAEGLDDTDVAIYECAKRTITTRASHIAAKCPVGQTPQQASQNEAKLKRPGAFVALALGISSKSALTHNAR